MKAISLIIILMIKKEIYHIKLVKMIMDMKLQHIHMIILIADLIVMF